MKHLLGEWRNYIVSKLSVLNRQQPDKATTRYTYTDGPMFFLGQQIIRKMEEMGYPSKIYTLYRSPKEQEQKKRQGLSRASAWQSPHQFYEAVDIASAVHPAWPPKNDPYWMALKDAIAVVEQEFGVELTGGFDWGWDYAHIEIEDWRIVRKRLRAKGGYMRPPNQHELDARFEEVLPRRWKQFLKSKKGHDHVSQRDATAKVWGG